MLNIRCGKYTVGTGGSISVGRPVGQQSVWRLVCERVKRGNVPLIVGRTDFHKLVPICAILTKQKLSMRVVSTQFRGEISAMRKKRQDSVFTKDPGVGNE